MQRSFGLLQEKPLASYGLRCVRAIRSLRTICTYRDYATAAAAFAFRARVVFRA
jgi:hypothetical protein